MMTTKSILALWMNLEQKHEYRTNGQKLSPVEQYYIIYTGPFAGGTISEIVQFK